MLPNVNIFVSSINAQYLFEISPIRDEDYGITQSILDQNKRHQLRKCFVSLLCSDNFDIGIFTFSKGGRVGQSLLPGYFQYKTGDLWGRQSFTHSEEPCIIVSVVH